MLPAWHQREAFRVRLCNRSRCAAMLSCMPRQRVVLGERRRFGQPRRVSGVSDGETRFARCSRSWASKLRDAALRASRSARAKGAGGGKWLLGCDANTGSGLGSPMTKKESPELAREGGVTVLRYLLTRKGSGSGLGKQTQEFSGKACKSQIQSTAQQSHDCAARVWACAAASTRLQRTRASRSRKQSVGRARAASAGRRGSATHAKHFPHQLSRRAPGCRRNAKHPPS